MLRKAASTLLGLEGRITQGVCASSYATKPDYALAMQQASELVKPSESTIQAKEASYTTGVPMETFDRVARIFSPAKTASQSGFANTIHSSSASPGWTIEFATQAKWINPLIGWSSTADVLENVARASLFFHTKEQAMAFCTKHGWSYVLDEPNVRRTSRHKRWNSYMDNFTIKRKGMPDLSTLPSNRK